MDQNESSKEQVDPHGRKASDPGAKLDSGKVLAGVLGDFSLALNAVAEVGTYGVNKYSRGGWQHVPDAQTRYTDALWRHLLAESTEPVDPESGLAHQAHLAWNILAILELMLRGESNNSGCANKSRKLTCDSCTLKLGTDECIQLRDKYNLIFYS